MGFNPFRPQHRSNFDYVFVATGLLLTLLLVLWAAGAL
jgi:hypothetical protein